MFMMKSDQANRPPLNRKRGWEVVRGVGRREKQQNPNPTQPLSVSLPAPSPIHIHIHIFTQQMGWGFPCVGGLYSCAYKQGLMHFNLISLLNGKKQSFKTDALIYLTFKLLL